MTRLKELRNICGKTQADIAAVIGVTRAAYTNIENGARNPSPAVAQKIASALGFDWTKFYETEKAEAQLKAALNELIANKGDS